MALQTIYTKPRNRHSLYKTGSDHTDFFSAGIRGWVCQAMHGAFGRIGPAAPTQAIPEP